ncbi:MAG TPA: FAD-dependent oxidoreductase, partial [Solirubrobacterales bacterium]|nr:FAD-dependent oxidoreductase [Solirubrobacterales bacterium]
MKHTAHGYWLEEAGKVEPLAELEGERSADVVVIGGGYTGLWTAWHLKKLEPGARVVVLEAGVCGQGPSGRNGGFCNSMWFSLPNMRERWGDEEALAVARAAHDAIDGVEAFCRDEGVDAWFRRGGYLQVSTAGAHDGVWDDAVGACRELVGPGFDGGRGNGIWGGDGDGTGRSENLEGDSENPVGEGGRPADRPTEVAQALGAAEVAQRCASPAFRGGAYFPDAATVQPARLALGLRERLRAAGVEIYEHSPVRRLRPDPATPATNLFRCSLCLHGAQKEQRSGGSWDGRGVVAETAGGARVLAGAAVVAIGGAAKAPRGPLRDSLTVTSSHIVLTEPVPELLEQIGWTGGECITDSRALIDYFRTTPDGRIAF